MGTLFRKGLACFLVLFGTLAVSAEQLPVKTYTIADGLARDSVNSIKQDSHGFLWFCTVEGISRFDGYTFSNYGVAEGLPHRVVDDMVETRDGDYLFGTDRGLVQFNPAGRDENGSFFTLVPLNEDEIAIFALTADPDGTVWAGTSEGLYHLQRSENKWAGELINIPVPYVRGGVASIFKDAGGILWAGTAYGVLRILPDGAIEHYGPENGLPEGGIARLLEDRSGRIWMGSIHGLGRLVSDPQPGKNVVERLYTTKDGLGHNFIDSLYQSSDGRLWVGTRGGLNVLVDDANRDGAAFRSFTETNGGIPNIRVQCLLEDRDNNIWIGAENSGVRKIPLSGFASYFVSDGLGHERVNQIFADLSGNDYVMSSDPGTFFPTVTRFDGKRMIKQRLDLPLETQLSWGWNQQIAQDPDGDLWVGTQSGVFRFGGHASRTLDNLPLKRRYGVEDGIDDAEIFRLFVDASGDILFSSIGPNSHSCFHRLDKRTGSIRYFTPEEIGRPPSAATAFANDPRDGSLWMGFYTGGIARYSEGKFTNYTERDGVPAGFIRDLFFDHENRLWVATALGGVGRVNDPSVEKLEFITYTPANGLSSNQVTTVKEDRWGHIYLGTGRGIDRLDLDGDLIRKIKHYTIADGLSDNFVSTSFCDSDGALWFGTLRGVSRFMPQPDPPHPPPPILISGVNAAGDRQPVSELGTDGLSVPDLSYTQNQLQIDFFSISYAAGDSLSYQYKFDHDHDWSRPTQQRSINLANLSPGSYRFLVRAVNSDGVISPHPAGVSFMILSPVWRRWWFIALVLLAVAVMAVGFYLYRTSQLRTINLALTEAKLAEVSLRVAREERLAELEKVRSRIATDLHDDIGASLTQITILSEVAQAQTKKGNGAAAGSLTKISEVSNELVSTMSDIVWSINPAKDHVSDLTQRMRRFAADILTLRSIRFHYEGSDDVADIVVKSNLRREVFLIFKESINNIVKHANAKNVWTEVNIDGGKLNLTIRDDGTGFDPGDVLLKEKGGNGLASMRRRTLEIGGEFDLCSAPGKPTEVRVSFPVENLSATIS